MVYAFCVGETALKHEVARETFEYIYLTVWVGALESNMSCDMQNVIVKSKFSLVF